MAIPTMRSLRAPRAAATRPLHEPERVNDLRVGWQNLEMVRIDHESGKTLLAVYGRRELDQLIVALEATRAHMQREHDELERYLAAHPDQRVLEPPQAALSTPGARPIPQEPRFTPAPASPTEGAPDGATAAFLTDEERRP